MIQNFLIAIKKKIPRPTHAGPGIILIEFSRAIQRHESGDALVVGIVVDDCLWEEKPLRKIQVVPKDALPIVRHPHRSEVWKAVVKRIQEAIADREARGQRRGW